jgi:uncharacterized protein (DUF58 family)
MTREGGRAIGPLVTLALGGAVLVAAALFGTPSLYPLGLALVILPLVAVSWVTLAARGLRLQRSAPAGPLLEGEPGRLRLRIVAGRLRPPGGVLREPLRPRPLPFGPRLLAIDEEISFPRRGRVSPGRAELVVADPLGLVERRIAGAEAAPLLVLPRPEPITFQAGAAGGRSLGVGERGGGGRGPDSWAAEFEIEGLRPYREGTPAARIHWPTAARTGELHERRISAGADAARLLVFDPRSPADSDALDRAARAAASLCLELSTGGCSVLVPPFARPAVVDSTLRGWPEIHARLAVVGPDDGAPAIERIGRAGLVVWVSAEPGPRPERELRRVPAAARVLVRPGVSDEGAALFRVAGCSGHRIGSVIDRRRAAV